MKSISASLASSARVLPRWSPDMPGRSIAQGMYVFGLEETGDYTRAEETGRQALD
nr:hypothetical protein BN993_03177 [Virgibacillus halodenitrificans]